MSKDRIVVDYDRENYVWRLAWFLAEDGDVGATLGEDKYTAEDLASSNREDREHIAACLSAREAPGRKRDRRGHYWESEKEARAALRVVKAALKADSPAMPEWAVKALAEGWSAPKGWKP